jgi:hypothetical protein
VWSWLGNPAVALVGFLSSVITIMQMAIAVTVFAKRKMPKTEKQRQRLSVGVALVSMASVVVVSAVTWSGVLAAAARIGDGGVNGVLYALIAPLLGTFATLILFVDAASEKRDRRLSRSAICMLMCSMALMIGMDLSVRNAGSGWGWGWGAYLILAAEVGMVCLAVIFHFISDLGQPKDSDVHDQPARTSVKASGQARQ